MAERTVPEHIGIIMDGNGRWAAGRGLPRNAGHAKGADVFKKIAEHCQAIGVKVLTVYAFSTENWKRPEEEVSGIMRLLRKYLDGVISDGDEGMCVRFIGRRDRFGDELLQLIESVERESAGNRGLILNLAVDYGGRDEITAAARKLAADCAEGRISADEIDEKMMDSHMYTAGCPDPDFIIRPSGEKRLSNFMLWQCAYSEFIYMDTLWPDFTPELLDQAIEEFNKRNRRYGA